MQIPLTYKIPKVPYPLDFRAISVDRTWETLEMDVTPDDVSRWLRLYDDDDPWSTGPSPFGGPIAPPSIFYYTGQNAFAPLRDFAGVLTGIGFDAVAPVLVGSHLTATTRVLERYQRRGRAYVAYELTIRDGETLVSRTRRTWAFAMPEDLAASYPEKTSESTPASEIVFERLKPLSLELSLERMIDFEGPGEHNGHTDPEMAKRSGATGPLAQGALSFGLLSRMLRNRFGKAWFAGSSIDCRLIRPVYAGDTVTAQGEITRIENGRAECAIRVTNRNGDVTVVGAARADLAS